MVMKYIDFTGTEMKIYNIFFFLKDACIYNGTFVTIRGFREVQAHIKALSRQS